MIIDVSTFVGGYPYRHLPESSPEFLLREMDRIGISEAWVGHLPSFLYRDPAPGTTSMVAALEGTPDRLRPVPTIHPGLPQWSRDMELARSLSAPAVRVYPLHHGLDPCGGLMHEVVAAAAGLGLPVILTVRLEDTRQRHAADTVPDLPPSAVRALARTDAKARILVTHAGRGFIEEVHFGLTSAEAARVMWDITWIWGPPHRDLTALVGSIGADRFAFGTGMPLRIPDAAPAKLDLAGLSPDQRAAIESENVTRWLAR